MQDSWRKRRKKMFIYSFLLILLAFIFYKAYPYINPDPTCFDNKINGDEAGIDCGGSCELSCHTEVIPVEVKFSRAVKTENNLYDIIAIVQNKNINKDIRDGIINYTFSIYDKAGIIIDTLKGQSIMPTGQTFPIILQNIPLNLSDSGNEISKVITNISFNNDEWIKVDPVFANNFFTVISTDFIQNQNNISQLTVNLKNITKANFKNTPVRITLEDEIGNFIAVNETIIPEIKAEANATLSFTWRMPLAIANPKITVYPIITPNSEFK